MKKLIRRLTKSTLFEKPLIYFASGKGDESWFVKILPRHFQYTPQDVRIINRKGIKYEVSLNNYNDWLLFFGIDNQHKENIYAKINNGNVILDVGSNIGEVLLNMAKVNPEGTIYGFEPVKSTFEKLQKNVSLNRFSSISLHQLALSDTNEIVYYQTKEGHSGGTMMSKESKNISQDFIEAKTLDHFVEMNSIEKIDFIKVDIEGFEMNFLKGAIETLKKFKPSIFMEVDCAKLNRQNSSAEELIATLQSIGYKVSHAENNQEINSNYQQIKHFDVYCTPV